MSKQFLVNVKNLKRVTITIKRYTDVDDIYALHVSRHFFCDCFITILMHTESSMGMMKNYQRVVLRMNSMTVFGVDDIVQ
jgi:hypothetical protein